MDNIPENPQRSKFSPEEAKPAEKNDKNQTREQSGKGGGGGNADSGSTKQDDKQTSGKS